MWDMRLSMITAMPATLLDRIPGPVRLTDDELLPPGPLVVLVTGSRTYTDFRTVYATLDQFPIKFLVQGGAPGADRYAKAWAIQRSIPNQEYPAEWERYGRSAGPRRNRFMYSDAEPDLVVAFKDGFGSTRGGTEDMTFVARRGGTPVWLVDHGLGRWLS